jgi:hypothetical protein
MIILPPSKQHPQFNYQSPALPLAQAPSEEPQCQPPALFTPHQSLDRLTTLLPSIRHQPAPTPPLHLVTVPREANTTLKRPMSSPSVPSSSKSSLSSSREPPPIDPVRTKPLGEEAGFQTPRSTRISDKSNLGSLSSIKMPGRKKIRFSGAYSNAFLWRDEWSARIQRKGQVHGRCKRGCSLFSPKRALSAQPKATQRGKYTARLERKNLTSGISASMS